MAVGLAMDSHQQALGQCIVDEKSNEITAIKEIVVSRRA
jgi:hypothetical protein